MKLSELSIKNYRSIKEINQAEISSIQALIGENNTGKSNVLDAIDVFLSSGGGGVSEQDFNDPNLPIVIKLKFSIQSPHLKKIWRPYAINDELIVEKHIWLESDADSEKVTLKNAFHGYKAEPRDWFLSIDKIIEKEGGRPTWRNIVEENALPDYFLNNGNCNKTDFAKGLSKYLNENDVEYEEPDLSETQALGLSSYVVSSLPKFYLLKAETKYSDETDKRSSSTTFRKLMGDLTDRIIKKDPKYQKIEEALTIVNELLNEPESDAEEGTRLESLSSTEEKIKDILCDVMPSVEKVKLKVVTDDIKTIFSKGVELRINDGVETDVLLKGHGLQRCILFSLLKALIMNERRELIDEEQLEENLNPIILAVEEPELYIHPQIGKLFYDVLVEFSEKDQVIYTTHSPRFIDVYNYQSIALIKKTKAAGTKFVNCNTAAFDGLTNRSVFKKITQLNSDVNELFFATKVLVVEGPEDKIAVTETAKELGMINTRLEEKDVTITVAGGKESIPFFVRVLNAFNIEYVVLHDLDITADMSTNNKEIHEKTNGSIKDLSNNRVINFPVKLENTLSLEKGHFKDQYATLMYFSDSANINGELKEIVKKALSIIGVNE